VRRHPLAQMLALGAIASAIGIAIALSINWFPSEASSQADDIDYLFNVLLVVSVPVFVLVEVVVLFCVWKFRMKPGEELKDGPPIHGNTTLEVFWTAIPAMLLVGLCTYAYVVLHRIEKPQPNSMVVNVTGEQFAWSYQFPAASTGGRPVSTNVLYLPKDRPVQFRVRSKDVIHDFWVPNFRMKIDAVPGLTTKYRITPSRLGTYPVVCAELCGLGHAAMRSTVRVVTPAAFRLWIAKQARGGPAPGAAPAPAPAAGGEAAANGRTIFTQTAQPACGTCHTLAAAGTTGTAGPNLGQVLKGKDAAFIRQSILNPNAQIAPGFSPGIMPQNFGSSLSKAQLAALVAYLEKVAAK
jgi:cytochrome c oxidase subunit II